MRPPRSPPRLAAAALATATALLLLLLVLITWPASSSSSSRAPRAVSTRGPSFAYWISGTGGDARRMLRLLRAVYHTRNRYLLHLDASASREERAELAGAVRAERAWREAGNVDVVGEGYPVDRAGPSALAAALHGAAVLLRVADDWDWLVTQHDLLYAFSSVPRELNFIDHTSDLGWKEHDRFEKLIIDPSLYMDINTKPIPATQTRQMPDAFKIFTGSPWVILSRNFTEHCVLGWDSLPRQLLMYFANTAYSLEAYFQTVICNSSDFSNTTVNRDLRYFVWDNPPGLEPLMLDESHFDNMVNSSTAFARKFVEDAPVLKKVDEELLNRSSLCLMSGGKGAADVEACSKLDGVNVVRPTRAGQRLRSFISEIIQTRGCS